MLKLFPVKTLEEMIGKSDFDFHKKEAAQQYYEEEMEIIRKKKGFIDQLQHEIMENGVEQWVSTTKLPLLDHKGNAIGTFGISKNVTQFKKLELETKSKNDELQAQEEELKQTMEEMKAIQEAMAEKEDTYKKQIEKLKKGK